MPQVATTPKPKDLAGRVRALLPALKKDLARLIPLVASLGEAAPDAEILLMGASDGYANIHGPNERVLVDELEKSTVAIAELFGLYASAIKRKRS